MRFKYIGLKTDGERAFMEKTGIEWMPGSEHEVDEKVAAEMAGHPTIWQQVGDEPIAAATPAQPRARHLPADDQDDEPQVPRTHPVDDQDVDDAATKAEAAAKPEPVKAVAKAAKPAAKKSAAKAKK